MTPESQASIERLRSLGVKEANILKVIELYEKAEEYRRVQEERLSNPTVRRMLGYSRIGK